MATAIARSNRADHRMNRDGKAEKDQGLGNTALVDVLHQRSILSIIDRFS
jgi:hypothetical protein